MSTRRLRRFSTWVVALAAWANTSNAFVYIMNDTTSMPVKWQIQTISMQVKLGTTPLFADGTNYSTSAQAAMDAWNSVLGGPSGSSRFISTVTSGTATDNNGVNEMVFAADVYGTAFEANTIAVTMSRRSGNERVEADIIFNSGKVWSSYRGAAQPVAIDIRRVALHELGHVLGLNHPDQATPPQTVASIMNSVVSNQEILSTDDTTGITNLYGPPGVPPNDNFSNAIVLDASTSVRATGFNSNSSKETLEPAHAGLTGGRSVWWKFTAVGANQITITTQGSLFDTLLGVYTGSSVSALTPIASNDDVQSGRIQYSSVSFTAIPGTTYYVAVDGFTGDTSSITLNVLVDGAPIGSPPVATPAPVVTPTPSPTPAPASSSGGGAMEPAFALALMIVSLRRRRGRK